MSDYVPIYAPGHEITQTTSAAVTGGQVLANSGDNTVAPAITASAKKYLGVAAHDAASGAKVTVLSGVGMVHESTAQGAITAGDLVIVGSVAGTVASAGVTPAQDAVIGLALSSAADTGLVKWKARV